MYPFGVAFYDSLIYVQNATNSTYIDVFDTEGRQQPYSLIVPALVSSYAFQLMYVPAASRSTALWVGFNGDYGAEIVSIDVVTGASTLVYSSSL